MRVDLAVKAFFQTSKESDATRDIPASNRSEDMTVSHTRKRGIPSMLQNQTIFASKIGKMKAVDPRPCEGKIKTMTIRRSSTGKWYVSFAVEQELVVREHIGDEVTGIDLGLTTFAMFSNGEKIENPRFFRTDENALAKAQRRISKEAKGTSERAKGGSIVAKSTRTALPNKSKNLFIRKVKVG